MERIEQLIRDEPEMTEAMQYGYKQGYDTGFRNGELNAIRSVLYLFWPHKPKKEVDNLVLTRIDGLKYIQQSIDGILSRLEKAKEVFRIQRDLIHAASQMSVDGVIKPE